MLCDFILEAVDEFPKGEVELLAALENGIWWSDLSIGLHLDFDLLLKRVALLVASKSNPRVLEKLVSDAVAQGVVLVLDNH